MKTIDIAIGAGAASASSHAFRWVAAAPYENAVDVERWSGLARAAIFVGGAAAIWTSLVSVAGWIIHLI